MNKYSLILLILLLSACQSTGPVKSFTSSKEIETLSDEENRLWHQANKFDIRVNVRGGGIFGQSGAIRHGISRALVISDPALREPLKKAGLLTRDSRMKERKKYGQPGARARFQYSKR